MVSDVVSERAAEKPTLHNERARDDDDDRWGENTSCSRNRTWVTSRYEANAYPAVPPLHLGRSAFPLGSLRRCWLWTSAELILLALVSPFDDTTHIFSNTLRTQPKLLVFWESILQGCLCDRHHCTFTFSQS